MLDEGLDTLSNMLGLVRRGMTSASGRAPTNASFSIKRRIYTWRGVLSHICNFVCGPTAIFRYKVPNRVLLVATLPSTGKRTIKQILDLLLLVLFDPYILKHFLSLLCLIRLDTDL